MPNSISAALSAVLVSALVLQEPASTQQSTSPDKAKSTAAQQASDGPKSKPAPAFAFGIEDGTRIALTLSRELSSGKESAGNRVDFDVAEEVKVNGIVVIPVGAKAWGTILNAKPKRRMGRAGQLDVKIDEVRLADGERVPLRATQESKGKGKGGAMTAGIIATGVLFFPAAPLFLFMHGKDVVIAKGTPVTAYVDADVALDQSKFAKAAEAATAAPKDAPSEPAKSAPAAEAPATPPAPPADSPKPPR